MKLIILLLAITSKVIVAKPAATTVTNTASTSHSDNLENVFDRIISVNMKKNQEKQSMEGNKASSQGRHFFEADIVMTNKLRDYLNKQKTDKKVTHDVINNGRWPGGVVPYAFDPDFTYQSSVEAAIEEYHEKSCIRFKPRTNEADYIYFLHDGGCWSSIGYYAGGKQEISLGYGCGFKGIAIHEILHALGFFHEQSRLDRDNYVTINWDNIAKGMEHNFEKHGSGEATDMNEAYDKRSVMHYGNYAFAVDYTKMTIISKSSSNERFGQRDGLSVIDIKQLNKYYQCSGVEKVTTTTTPKTTTKMTTTTPTTTTTTPTTTTPTTTTQEPRNIICKDTMACCPALAFNGLCSKSNYVFNNCKKSCFNCPIITTTTTTTSTTPSTTDGNCQDKVSQCIGWAKNNAYCKFGTGCCVGTIYSTYMVGNCAKSCGFC